MPNAAPRLCATCRQLVTEPRCPRCTPAAYINAPRTRQRNGSTRAWRRLRLAVFTDQRFICAGWPTPGTCAQLCTQLDHIVPIADDGDDTRDNVQGLCDDCHRAKTQHESQRPKR